MKHAVAAALLLVATAAPASDLAQVKRTGTIRILTDLSDPNDVSKLIYRTETGYDGIEYLGRLWYHEDDWEDEGLPDFRKHASWELRVRLGELWVQFYAKHPHGEGIQTSSVDPEEYLDENAP